MLNKIRRNSKQLLDSKRNSGGSRSIPNPRPTTRQRKLAFFDLPAEIRNVIYEDIARQTSITVPLTTKKNGKKAEPIPSLLLGSRQTRQEYLPVLLEFASARVVIKEFDFRNLIRLLGSLYPGELKRLRENKHLTIQLVGEKCNRDTIVSLRRWLDNRSNGLDRLPWSYSIYWKSKHEITPGFSEDKKVSTYCRRQEILEQNLEGMALLDKNVSENLKFELRPIIAAFETELHATP